MAFLSLWPHPWQSLQRRIPTQCLACQHWPIFTPLCKTCLEQQAAAHQRCHTCALPLPENATTRACGHCLRQPPPLAACWAAVDYAAPWRQLIHRWKFGQQPAWAQAGAQLMLARIPWDEVLSGVDVLLPIPPSAARLRWRGFHHTLLLAQAVQQALPQTIALAPQTLLRLPEATEQAALHQARRKRQERIRAMQGAFIVPQPELTPLQGRRILLLDDVMTTGATLYSAAHCLQQAGAAQVSAVVLARTA